MNGEDRLRYERAALAEDFRVERWRHRMQMRPIENMKREIARLAAITVQPRLVMMNGVLFPEHESPVDDQWRQVRRWEDDEEDRHAKAMAGLRRRLAVLKQCVIEGDRLMVPLMTFQEASGAEAGRPGPSGAESA